MQRWGHLQQTGWPPRCLPAATPPPQVTFTPNSGANDLTPAPTPLTGEDPPVPARRGCGGRAGSRGPGGARTASLRIPHFTGLVGLSHQPALRSGGGATRARPGAAGGQRAGGRGGAPRRRSRSGASARSGPDRPARPTLPPPACGRRGETEAGPRGPQGQARTRRPRSRERLPEPHPLPPTWSAMAWVSAVAGCVAEGAPHIILAAGGGAAAREEPRPEAPAPLKAGDGHVTLGAGRGRGLGPGAEAAWGGAGGGAVWGGAGLGPGTGAGLEGLGARAGLGRSPTCP